MNYFLKFEYFKKLDFVSSARNAKSLIGLALSIVGDTALIIDGQSFNLGNDALRKSIWFGVFHSVMSRALPFAANFNYLRM